MKSFNRIIISILLLTAVMPVAALGQSFVDPSLQWKALETEHFRIIFHQGTEGLAQEAALIAEESYQVLAKEFDYAPAGKTNIVIIDATDFANGFAIPIPNNDIVIFTSYADMGSWANVRLKSWLQMVIFHEYVHIVDIDKVSGISKTLRDIFGKIVLPNVSKPTFFIEGIAVYEKFKYLGESRANAPRGAMYLREMALENDFPSFSQASFYYSRREWPHPGMISRNYGPWFMRYIEEKYGKDKISKIGELNAKNLLSVLTLGLANDFGWTLKRP